VGDTVTSVITDPNRGTTTLTHVLTAADVATGEITQTIPARVLATDGSLDGPWTTTTTVTDVAGNVSPVADSGFILDTGSRRQSAGGAGTQRR
jgi:hypothetical protein